MIDAVTTKESPDTVPDEDADDPYRWSPRADPLTRCIALTDRVLSAHRQATESLHGALTYVRLPSPVLAYTAAGVQQTDHIDGQLHSSIKPVGEWSEASMVLLDHTNLADPFTGKAWDHSIADRFGYWLREQERGNPLRLGRERYIEARRALFVTGELSNAVLQANTSCEVLLDVVLALLMWEEGEQPSAAAPAFEHGKVLRRVTNQLPSRLKGNWSTQSGPIGDWYRDAYRLRHRIVHGGYVPTPAEAQAALNAASKLQAFLWDRLAAVRTTYPRSALMTLAREGLEQRKLWSGKIRRFAEEIAPTEPSWRDDFSDFYAALTAATAEEDAPEP